jgi:hypothetical protein
MYSRERLMMGREDARNMQFYNRFQAESVPSWLCLEEVIKNLLETHQCQMYSRELLMMGREDAQNV